MKRCTVLILLGIASSLAVFAYNFWAACCGRCSVRNFLVIGPFEMSMIGLMILAALVSTVSVVGVVSLSPLTGCFVLNADPRHLRL